LDQLRSCFAHMPLILAVSDREGRYVWSFNPHPQVELGVELGKTDLELRAHPSARALYALKRRVISSGEMCVEELELPASDGPRTFEVTAAPLLEQGVLIGVSTVALDLTSLRASNEARTRLREEQLRLVSHDLRQPLNVIAMAAGRLASVAEVGSPVGLLSECITTSVRAMSRVLEDILESGEWETGGILLHREPTDIAAYLRETFTAGITPDGLLRLQLDIDHSCVVDIDRSKFGRAVLNLVDNALKFSPTDAPVRVWVGCQANTLRVIVSDLGPGLDGDTAAHAFDKYHASVGSRASGGKGLGLYCARLVVEAHGGSCKVESEAGSGAVFTIELPHSGRTPLAVPSSA
jgi:signal transduction histidine kinase